MAVVSDSSNDVRLAELAAALADGVEEALPAWTVRCVEGVLATTAASDPEVLVRAREAGEAARVDIGRRVRTLLETDVDQQWTNPLAIVREAVAYPTRVLHDAGAPPVPRDAIAERQFPDDDYDLTPARFGELDPRLHDVSIAWGAAKAFVVKARHAELRP
jgi:hypothetical protein